MVSKKLRLVVAAAIGATALTGCASMGQIKGSQGAAQQLKHLKKQAANDTPGVQVKSGVYVDRNAVAYTPPKGQVSLNANGAPIGPLLNGIAKNMSVVFVGKASGSTKVTLHLHDVSRNEAIRQLAAAAGYATVMQPNRDRVMIATQATYVYRIPNSYLSGTSSSYAVGGNTAAGGSRGGSMGGGPGGGSMGGAAPAPGSTPGGGGGSSTGGGNLTASFEVNGNSKPQTKKDLINDIRTLAGKQSRVTVEKGSGLVTVTATGPALDRVTGFIRAYSQNADTRVAIHAAILQVQLNKAMQFGVNLNKLLTLRNGATLKLLAPNNAPASGLSNSLTGTSSAASSIQYTSNSVSAVINAIQKNTNVKIVSQPNIVAGNGTPATLFSGTQLPYVGSVESNVSGLSGTSTTGSSLSYVLNGLSLSFLPQVISDKWVNLRLIPAISRVQKFDTFTVSGNKLQGPEQAMRQVFLQLLAPTGKTVILAGSEQSTQSNANTETPLLSRVPVLGKAFKGYNNQGTHTQLVILIRANVLPAPKINPLIAQSL